MENHPRLTPYDVFTPNGVPTVTYINRGGERKLEEKLERALKTPGQIISLSGPSKSGKTTLVNKVVSQDNLIPVSGGAIKDADALWDRVLNWMDAPSEVHADQKTTVKVEAGAETSLKAGLFGFGGEAKAHGTGGLEKERSGGAVRRRTGIDQVVKEVAGSEFVIFIDDFHYMPADVQADVSRQIKEAAEKNVRICTASVPHRADDVVRSNTELRGRVQAVDFEYWTVEEIEQIASAGFHALNISVSSEILKRLANEAFGSPQLMQQICLQFCFYFKVEGRATSLRPINPERNELATIFEQASTTTDFSTLLAALHAGPKPRGTDRNKYSLTDGSRGDVYRCVLLAMREDPPLLNFSYDEIYRRSKVISGEDGPTGSSLASALDQMSSIAADSQPGHPVLKWSDDVLDIADPYFLYYLRCSSRFDRLGSQ